MHLNDCHWSLQDTFDFPTTVASVCMLKAQFSISMGKGWSCDAKQLTKSRTLHASIAYSQYLDSMYKRT